MKDLREVEASSIKIIDDWCSIEELQYLIWSFEYDCDDKSLWEEVKQGENHFPRKLSSYLYDKSCRATQYIFSLRDKLIETARDYFEYPTLFAGQSMLEGLIDSSFLDGLKPPAHYYELVLFLNDDFEGGEVVFNDRDIIVTPRAGSLLMFPSKELWTIKEVKGSSYKIRIKLTDKPEHREDDPGYTKIPFSMKQSPTEQKGKVKKSKGCGGCVDPERKGLII